MTTPPSDTPPQAPQIPPQAVLMNMLVDGIVLGRALGTVAVLGVPDQLAQGPRTVEEIAQATGTHPEALFRLMRLLAGAGVFAQEGERRFKLGPLGGPLVSDAPGSLAAWARYLGHPWYWEIWSHLPATIQNGKTIHENIHGKRFFDWYASHPERARAFDEGMTSVSAMINPAIAYGYDYSGVGSLVDVAGGQGSLLAAILAKHPDVRGTLYDQSSVIEQARASGYLAPFEKAGRAELLSGNIFESMPPGRDAYLFKWILHDWNDAEARTILGACRRAMGAPGKKLLLAETVLETNDQPSLAKAMDVTMMALTGGRERTVEEFRALLSATGFELTRVVPTPSPFSIVEGVSV